MSKILVGRRNVSTSEPYYFWMHIIKADNHDHLDHIDNMDHLDHLDHPDHMYHLDHPNHPDYSQPILYFVTLDSPSQVGWSMWRLSRFEEKHKLGPKYLFKINFLKQKYHMINHSVIFRSAYSRLCKSLNLCVHLAFKKIRILKKVQLSTGKFPVQLICAFWNWIWRWKLDWPKFQAC